MKWIHIDENQFDINIKNVTQAFIASGIPEKDAESIADQIACGHGYSFNGKNDKTTELLANKLLLSGVTIKTE